MYKATDIGYITTLLIHSYMTGTFIYTGIGKNTEDRQSELNTLFKMKYCRR